MSNNKYEKAKVYKIWSHKGDKIYVGSTTKQYLSQRMDKHRSDYRRFKYGKCTSLTSFTLFDEYGIENCFIELLEAKECNSKDELLQIEGRYIRELVCVNKVLFPYRTKEQFLDYQKQYKADNKEKIFEQHRKVCNCECSSTYTYGNKSQHLKTKKHCKFIESQNT